jgi:hypothetical protein
VHSVVTPSDAKRAPAVRKQCINEMSFAQNRWHSSHDEKFAAAISFLQVILALCHVAQVSETCDACKSKHRSACSPKGDRRSHSFFISLLHALDSEKGLITGAAGISGAPGLCRRCGACAAAVKRRTVLNTKNGVTATIF